MLVAGSVAGGGKAALRSQCVFTGSTGGAKGGGGTVLDELLGTTASVDWPPLWFSLFRVISVSVCSVLVSFSEYSQHGKTLWPDGARSSWKVSVPGGRARSRS